MTASKTAEVLLSEGRKAFGFLIVMLAGSSWHFQKSQLQSDSFQEIRKPRIHCHGLKFPSRALCDRLALSPGACLSSGIVSDHCNPSREFAGRKSHFTPPPWSFFFFFLKQFSFSISHPFLEEIQLSFICFCKVKVKDNLCVHNAGSRLYTAWLKYHFLCLRFEVDRFSGTKEYWQSNCESRNKWVYMRQRERGIERENQNQSQFSQITSIFFPTEQSAKAASFRSSLQFYYLKIAQHILTTIKEVLELEASIVLLFKVTICCQIHPCFVEVLMFCFGLC